MDNLISVVMPVHNVEKYLRQSIAGVINQTYKNLQIILVDDGSTDSSGKICDEYAENDNRITVIHQKNAGAGAAKNTGLCYIKGEYFSIIDSDDFIELDMYEKMHTYMQEFSADIVQCNFCNVYKNGHAVPSWKTEIKMSLISSQQFLNDMLIEWKYAIFWNKLFKTSLLQNSRFPVGRKIDDEFFTYQLISRAKMILNINDILYNYRMRKSSVMNESNNDRLIEDRADCFVERYEYIAKNEPKLKRKFYKHLSDILLLYYNSSGSQNVKVKLQNYIKKYPYKKQSIITRLLNKRKTTDKAPEKKEIQDGLVYFD